MILLIFFFTFSNVKALQAAEVDTWYLNLWTNTFSQQSVAQLFQRQQDQNLIHNNFGHAIVSNAM